MEKLFVTGYNQLEDGSLSVLVKDKISAKNPLRRLTAEQKPTKHGSFWVNKGTTRDEAKAAYPVGSMLMGAQWGEEVASAYGGIYQIVFDDEVAEVENKEGE